RLVFNLFVVWTLTGLWHGASWHFVAWGVMYFLLLAMEKLAGIPEKIKGWGPPARLGYRVFTMFMVMMGWVVFRAPDMGKAVDYMKNMFLLRGYENYVTWRYVCFLLLGVALSTPVFNVLSGALWARHRKMALALGSVGCAALFFMAEAGVLSGGYSPFIYFNF
ncbi:MAG: hypothetical protein LBR77_05465, partial [Lachnospiraceae bacterium]|nr:hypothetical protein [Lachnospiraceae bacterium]